MEFYKCEFCNKIIDWEGSDSERGKVWECEECGSNFCEACFTERCGEQAFLDVLCADGKEETVLCPNCYQKASQYNTMKEIIANTKVQEALDRIRGFEE